MNGRRRNREKHVERVRGAAETRGVRGVAARARPARRRRRRAAAAPAAAAPAVCQLRYRRHLTPSRA